jgi:hypothetical protein
MGERVKQGPLSKSINQCSDYTDFRPPSHGPRIRRGPFDADVPHFPEGQIDHLASVGASRKSHVPMHRLDAFDRKERKARRKRIARGRLVSGAVYHGNTVKR